MEISGRERAQIEKNIKFSKMLTVARRLARIVKHSEPEDKILKKRKKLEADIVKWLRFFGGDAFNLPFSPAHLNIIEKLYTAMKKGGLFALAMPRGHGKSTITKWAALYALLTGIRKYVVYIAATSELANSFIEFVKQQLIDNDVLHEYYPHITTYFRATEGKAIKAKYQLRADGESSGIVLRQNFLMLPAVLTPDGKEYPSNSGIIEAHGLTGAIRGKWKDSTTGEVIRPDFAILDDPQDRESAESEAQCAMRERIIMGDVLGLAGVKKRITAVMLCTVIRRGDLADRFLDNKLHPEWQGVRYKLIEKFPDEQDGLWEDYRKIYREDLANGKGMARATNFYKEHKEQMQKGAIISWTHRVREGEIDALQTAENLMIETGDAFFAEYQNEPKDIMEFTYRVEIQDVLKHITNIERFIVPRGHNLVFAATDINRVGLHYVIVAFRNDLSGHIVDYGRYPAGRNVWEANATEMVRKKKIFQALHELSGMIAGLPLRDEDGKTVKPLWLLIDRGYEPDVVHRFCNSAYFPFRLVPVRGYASQKYNVGKNVIGAPKENCHLTQSTLGQFIAFNADVVREIMHRGFLGEVGEIGSIGVYRNEPRQHLPFAEHITAEILRQKYKTDYGMRYEWVHLPGVQWDWADALSMAFVGALSQGLTTQGVVLPAKRREARKPKVGLTLL